MSINSPLVLFAGLSSPNSRATTAVNSLLVPPSQTEHPLRPRKSWTGRIFSSSENRSTSALSIGEQTSSKDLRVAASTQTKVPRKYASVGNLLLEKSKQLLTGQTQEEREQEREWEKFLKENRTKKDPVSKQFTKDWNDVLNDRYHPSQDTPNE